MSCRQVRGAASVIEYRGPAEGRDDGCYPYSRRKQRQHETAMTDAKRKMHLAIQAAAPGHPAGWRVPGGERQAGDDVAHYQDVARVCERALLDVLFLADSPSLRMTAGLRRARSIPSSSLPHALSRPSTWGSFSPPRPRSASRTTLPDRF